MLAREAARERPAATRLVITLGSPVVGGPKYTAVAGFYRRKGIDLDAVEAEVAARNQQPLETPITAIYSRNYAVVAWRACIDRRMRHVDHVEVEATHLGLGFSPRVIEIIPERLARPVSAGRARPSSAVGPYVTKLARDDRSPSSRCPTGWRSPPLNCADHAARS